MRHLILFLLASCIFYSCKPKKETTITTTTTTTAGDLLYKGQLITVHRDSSGIDRDTFNNSELELTFAGVDSAIHVRITDLDNNLSYSMNLSVVVHSVEGDNRDFYLCNDVSQDILLSIQFPRANDSVYFDYNVLNTPSTSIYFYGKK